jgi:hypothetical protein
MVFYINCLYRVRKFGLKPSPSCKTRHRLLPGRLWKSKMRQAPGTQVSRETLEAAPINFPISCPTRLRVTAKVHSNWPQKTLMRFVLSFKGVAGSHRTK